MTKEKLISALYRFSTRVEGEESSFVKQYSREVSLRQLSIKKDQTTYQILCKSFGFEDPQINSLIRKTAYVFDTLMLSINSKGRIISVEHAADLQKKWDRQKEAFQREYSGAAVSNYLRIVEKNIYDREKLIAFLESDKMYGLLFKSLYLFDNKEEMSFFKVLETGKTKQLIKESADKSLVEHYIYEDNALMEGIKINNYLQYEILCLGIEKY